MALVLRCTAQGGLHARPPGGNSKQQPAARQVLHVLLACAVPCPRWSLWRCFDRSPLHVDFCLPAAAAAAALAGGSGSGDGRTLNHALSTTPLAHPAPLPQPFRIPTRLHGPISKIALPAMMLAGLAAPSQQPGGSGGAMAQPQQQERQQEAPCPTQCPDTAKTEARKLADQVRRRLLPAVGRPPTTLRMPTQRGEQPRAEQLALQALQRQTTALSARLARPPAQLVNCSLDTHHAPHRPLLAAPSPLPPCRRSTTSCSPPLPSCSCWPAAPWACWCRWPWCCPTSSLSWSST